MPDPGFCAYSYAVRSIYQNAQELINWYPQVDERKTQGERGRITLYPTPGLTLQKQSITIAEVRGFCLIPNGLFFVAVIGNTLYSYDTTFAETARGTLLSASGPVRITTNGLVVYITDGANRYYWVYGDPVLGANTLVVMPGTDGAFTGGSACDFVDGFIIYSQPGGVEWGATALLSQFSPALSFASKFSSSDHLVTLIVDHREVYLLGELTTEAWVDVGAFPFPFQIVPGTNTQHGCAAKNSVARMGDSFSYLARDNRGTAVVVQMVGYQAKRISTFAVEYDLTGKFVADAIGMTYQLGGHEIYVLTFPTLDRTWCYDVATQMWHKWLSVDSLNIYHRHRANCMLNFNNQIIVGDYANGCIYALDPLNYTDNGAEIRRLRRCPHLTEELKRVAYGELQLQFQPGVGLSTGQGSMPQVMLRWSDDGGSTWSTEHWTGIGRIGQYANRARWTQLGMARDRVFEVAITDPVNAVLVSAELKAVPCEM